METEGMNVRNERVKGAVPKPETRVMGAVTNGTTGGELSKAVTNPELGMSEAVTNMTTEGEMSRVIERPELRMREAVTIGATGGKLSRTVTKPEIGLNEAMTIGATGGELSRTVTKPEIGLSEAVTNETTEDELSRTVIINARGDTDDLEAGASMTITGVTIKEEGGVKRRRKTRARRNWILSQGSQQKPNQEDSKKHWRWCGRAG
jgi:hypothetical protein